jgi:hypothetical protein
VDVTRRGDLMVPAAKRLAPPVGLPGPNDVDRFRCYAVKATSRAGGGAEPAVLVTDQFEQPKIYRIVKPSRLCVPVSKDGEAMKNPEVDLLCYMVKPARKEPKHAPVAGIHTRDEFTNEVLVSAKEQELCVPAEVSGP